MPPIENNEQAEPLRRSHWLRKGRGNERPRHCFFVDTETYNKPTDNPNTVIAELNFGYAAYTRRRIGMTWDSTQWQRFSKAREFWEWLDAKAKPKTKSYLFAHKLSFDLVTTQLFTILPSLGWYLTNFIVDDPPTMITWEHCPANCGTRSGVRGRKDSKCKFPHRTLVILDTLNFFKDKLSNLGKAVGEYKGDMPEVPQTRYETWEPELQKEWDIYGKQDVQVLITLVHSFLKFINDHKLGNFSITQASQSMTAFRHRFMKHDILIDNNPRALAMARSSYKGGRTEIFFQGKITGQTTYKLDINSQYPSIMRNGIFPTQIAAVWNRPTFADFRKILKDPNICYVAEVLIETDEPVYPVVRNKKLTFPTGRFPVSLAGPELEYAFENKHIVHFKQIAVYHGDPIFREYIDYFYNLRLDAKERGDEQDSYFFKIFMNSLYGKFGQNGRKWSEIEPDGTEQIASWEVFDHETGAKKRYRQMGGVIQEMATAPESLNSHPAIASYITSGARIYLWKLMKQAGWKTNVYYCDTDSLFVNEFGRDALAEFTHETELGKLKIEGETDFVELHVGKDYVFGDFVKIKGVARDKSGVPRKLGPNVYASQSFSGFAGMIRRGDLNNVFITQGKKHLKRIYDKGVVHSDGTVTPIELSED